MKKLWGAFWLVETLLLSGTLAAVLALVGHFPLLAALAGLSGSVAAAAYFLHFRSLKYSLENGTIIICKGILIRSRREIPLENVLMAQSCKFFGRKLHISLVTAGGTATLFCNVDIAELLKKQTEITPQDTD
ncbi:MAG: PH domain-containing protein [Lachnospiraceae bacterium]|nr:PH domain-containing protein [Ruminococcus sp.]MCM1274388.1 PH domain-containing protein [Lachnospiraceae bacterium]